MAVSFRTLSYCLAKPQFKGNREDIATLKQHGILPKDVSTDAMIARIENGHQARSSFEVYIGGYARHLRAGGNNEAYLRDHTGRGTLQSFVDELSQIGKPRF